MRLHGLMDDLPNITIGPNGQKFHPDHLGWSINMDKFTLFLFLYIYDGL
jgi:hypothetical protein